MKNTRSVVQDRPLGPSCVGKNIAMVTYYILLKQLTPKQPARLGPTKPDMAIVVKNSWSATSLVAQRLRICLSMQGIQVRALVWEDPTCREATKPVHHDY